MTLSYDKIFNYFLGNVEDYKIASLNIDLANEMMVEYLHKVLGDIYVRSLFSTAKLNDKTRMFSFEMKYPTDEDMDLEYVQTIIAKGMVIEWLRPQVESKVLLTQLIAGKEQKYYSQSNHIDALSSVFEEAKVDLRRSIGDRGYIYNSYLEEKYEP